ncbi:MAG: hypothetical protein ABI837_12130 [Acidobacteriota bacterium]
MKPESSNGSSVPFATHRRQEDAEAIAQILRNAGVEAAVTSEPPLFHVAVQREDQDRADEALNRHYGVQDAEEQPAVKEPPPTIKTCPECGSDDVERVSTLPHFAVLALLLYGVGVAIEQHGLALLMIAGLAVAMFIADRYRCAACGARWRGTA